MLLGCSAARHRGSRTSTTLTDDTGGSDAIETVTFAFKGSQYEIDLSKKNLDKMIKTQQPYTTAARKSGGRRSGTRRTPASAPTKKTSPPRSANGPAPTAAKSSTAAASGPPRATAIRTVRGTARCGQDGLPCLLYSRWDASDLLVPRLGVGAMTWGQAHGLARLHPAKIAHGGAEGRDEERGAWEASIAAGVTLFDTAAMYAGGASERRLGEFSSDAALIATKFPATMWASADDLPGQLADSLARLHSDSVDLYQHHFPSRRVDIPRLMNLMADAVAAGLVRAVGVSNYSAGQMRLAHAALARRGIPLASKLLTAGSPASTPGPTGLVACGALPNRSVAGTWRRLSRSPPCFSRSARATARPPRRWLCAG